MKTKIWNVTYSDKNGEWDTITVIAPNIKQAIIKARLKRKGEYCNRIQDISKVTFEIEAE